MSQLHILLPSGFIDRKMIYFRLLITMTKPLDDSAPVAKVPKGEPEREVRAVSDVKEAEHVVSKNSHPV